MNITDCQIKANSFSYIPNPTPLMMFRFSLIRFSVRTRPQSCALWVTKSLVRHLAMNHAVLSRKQSLSRSQAHQLSHRMPALPSSLDPVQFRTLADGQTPKQSYFFIHTKLAQMYNKINQYYFFDLK